MKLEEIKIGNTPIMELKQVEQQLNLSAHIYGKIEAKNPFGSVKDRVAYQMIKGKMEKGLLDQDTTLIEPTSGNTGIAIAAIANLLGNRCLIVMPDSMSVERRELIASYNAELVLTPGSEGMSGAINKAKELNQEIKNSVILSQFDNPDNPKAHYLTTGKEIWERMDGKVDIFIAGIGTGGTISGAGKYLKEKNKDIKIIGVEPLSSPVLTQGIKGKHKIQGIGAGFIPENLDTSIYDEVIAISDEDAYKYARMVNEGKELTIGISAGAALAASVIVANRSENKGKNIVAIFPDDASKYKSVL